MGGCSAEKVVTREITREVQTGGEITVNLVLTIRLENNNLSITAGDERKQLMKEQIVKNKEDKVDLIIPDIESEGLIQFGQKV